MVRLFYVLLCIVISGFSVQAANAETQSPLDWWGGDTDQSAPRDEFYWLAPADPSIVYQGVSLDAAIPIELIFYDPKYDQNRLDEALAFVHITANAVTDDGNGPTISGRLFRVPRNNILIFESRLLLGWQADQILEPDTTYRLTITADNEGLWRAHDLDPSKFRNPNAPAGNVSNELSIVTASRVLPLAPLPIIDGIYLDTKYRQEVFSCPEGQILCGAPNNCYDQKTYTKAYPSIHIDWHDNEEDVEEIFLEYLIRVQPFEEGELPQRVRSIWEDQHSADADFLLLPNDFEARDNYCVDLIVRDLRSYAAGQAEAEEQVSTHCIDGIFFVPEPTYENLAIQCYPIDDTPQPDADNTPDAADFFDATNQNNPDATDATNATDAGADADILPTDPGDEGACSCQKFYTAHPRNGFSILWMISLAVLFRLPFSRLFVHKNKDKT